MERITPKIPAIASVRALPDSRKVLVTWRDSRESVIDLAGFLAGFAVFVPLDNDECFAGVAVGEYGREIGCGGDMAIAARTLYRLATEQHPEATPADRFGAWMMRNGLSATTAAAVLGIGRRTVIYYRTGQKPIPRLVELACMGVELSGGADGKMVA